MYKVQKPILGPQVKWVGSERYCKNAMEIPWAEGYKRSLARGSRELKGDRCQSEKHPNLQRISVRLYLSQSDDYAGEGDLKRPGE